MSAPSFSVGRKKPSPVAVGRPVPPPPSFDDSELRRRLKELEGRVIPQFDPSALQARLAELEGRQAPVFDPSDLQRQIRELGQRPSRDDFMSIERQLQDLRNRDVPQFDPSNLQSQIGGLEDRLANLPQFDPSQLQAGIQGLSDRISNIPQFDPSALQNRLSALENRQAPTFNPEDFREQFLNIAREGIDIPQPTQAFDPSGLQNRLQALENREIPQFDPSRLQERLSALENVQPVAPPPAFDPSSLQARLDALENREPVAAPPAFDPSGLMARLDDFESRLGALQQPLPIQPPGDLNLDIKEDAPDIRNLAKELPEGGTIFDRLPEPTPPQPPQNVVGRPTPPQLIRGGPMGGGVPFEPIDLEPQPPQDDGTINDMPITIPVSGAGTNFTDGGRPPPPMSIGGPGGGQTDPRMFTGGSRTFDERGETFDPSSAPKSIFDVEDLSNITDEEIRRRAQMTPFVGMPTLEEQQETILSVQRELSRKRNEQRAQKGLPAYEDRVIEGLVPTGPDNIGGAPSLVDQQQDLSTGDDMPAPTIANEQPFAAGVTQVATGLDPLTEQLLFGIGGQGGFIPGAMRAAEKVFYDDQGNPVVIDEQVAGFSPDQLQAMQMQREALGMQDPYLQGAGQAFGAGTQALEEGLQRGRTAAIGALEATKGGVGSLQEGLGESADILRGTLGGYDPSMTDRFYDPFEDRVVQQTITDIMEQGAKSDIGARASDIARGGESAFGSRARLGAGERQEALGRGLAEALGGIRSRGFREAQQTGLGEFARQKAAERAASTGLASLAGQGFGGSQALAGALSGLGQTEQDIGQQRYSGQFGLGTSLQGLGAQAAGASASDIAALYGMGSQQQGQAQAMLDAQRRNLQQRQMTPLLQYQALAPFISMAPAGQFTTTTQFAPPPSPMQAGLGVGLSAFGALGQLYGGGQ